MEPFIRNDQYNFIKRQVQGLVNGHASSNDTNVLKALKSLTQEKVDQLFEELTVEQKQLLQPVIEIRNKEQADDFLLQLSPYRLPFKRVTEQTAKKLFPKVKKLKLPKLEGIDLTTVSYLGWNDSGTNRKYLIVETEGKLKGYFGHFKSSNKKGMCTICNTFGELGLFTAEIKGSTMDAYIKRGNYICYDSTKCNENLTKVEKLQNFIHLID
ncbi:FusB/FusC family EF-G-binding protein [Chungangia koreensis]|uniref:FusB/FusC family EF-G-binding protein n=1 Tax=Chungangia koreensis TaxID=752657 RepID=A0ABV8X8A5_9LACT